MYLADSIDLFKHSSTNGVGYVITTVGFNLRRRFFCLSVCNSIKISTFYGIFKVDRGYYKEQLFKSELPTLSIFISFSSGLG